MCRGLLLLGLVVLSGCTPRLEFRESCLPVLPRDESGPGPDDTTLVGTMVMLSDKLGAFDVVEISQDSAFRKARLVFDRPLEPYYGGAVKAHVKPLETGVSGYMIRAQLLDWEEIPLPREATLNDVEVILRKYKTRLDRMVREEGLVGWEPEGFLTLEGYDPKKGVAVYSMAGRTANLSYAEKQPLLVVWADKAGKPVKVYLTIITRRLERS